MDQRFERAVDQDWIARRMAPTAQHRDRIMAVQAFLVARNDPEITNHAGRVANDWSKQPGTASSTKDRVGSVQLRKRLLILALDHDLCFGRHSASLTQGNQILEPQHLRQAELRAKSVQQIVVNGVSPTGHASGAHVPTILKSTGRCWNTHNPNAKSASLRRR